MKKETVREKREIPHQDRFVTDQTRPTTPTQVPDCKWPVGTATPTQVPDPEQASGLRTMQDVHRGELIVGAMGVLEALPEKLKELDYVLHYVVRHDVGVLRNEVWLLKSVYGRHIDEILKAMYFGRHIDKPGGLYLANSAAEIAYDIEDWVDLHLHVYAAGSGSKSSTFLRWLLRKFTTDPANHIIAKELQNFMHRIVGCRELEWRCHYDDMGLQASPPCDSQRAMDNGYLVGLDGPIEEVVKLVIGTGTKSPLKIISIVGMIGSGKTTLASEVYKRLRRHNCFEFQEFVNLQRNLDDVMETLKDILLKLDDGHQQAKYNFPNLILRLSEKLEKKRYLIVLDDFCCEEHWTIIKDCFPCNSLGSRIITTTRNVALATESDFIYNMRLLNKMDSRNLILNRALGTGYSCPEYLEDRIAQITRMCGGLPLALVTLASMLAGQFSRDEWERLIGSRWLSISHPAAEVMNRMLNHGYNDLSPHLKTCLLYLSIFPENYKIGTTRLVRRWIAEGFFYKKDGTNMEELAISHLKELVSRNLVLPLHLKHDGIPKYFRIHPVIHDFVVSKSLEQNFVVTLVNTQQQDVPTNNSAIRHLSLLSGSNHDQATTQNDSVDLSHARSITFFGQASAMPHLTNLVVVRVLDFEGCNGPVCFDGLHKLVHLRYLSLRGTDVCELPATIGELKCLQTLDARSTKVKDLPPSIVKLKPTLEDILVSGKGMINLVEKATKMPEDFQHFQRLEKLGIIDLREHQVSFVKALGGLNRLQVLKITWSYQQSTERAYHEALVSSIKKWSQLESLTIHCELGCSMDFLGSWPSPPQKFKKFKVTAGRFVVVPQWVNGLAFLSFLQITLCKLCSGDLNILRNLPKLKWLILGLEFVPRKAIVIENDGFSELTRFSVDCPVPWLTFGTGAMPKLTNLELKFCSGPASQESVPSGIDNLQSLTEVVLCYNQTWCADSSSVKMTVEAVKEEVAKHDKTVKLVINDTVVNVQEVEEATEAYNEAEHGGEAKHDVQIAGEGTSKITSEIEEIEDDTKRGS